MWAGSARGELHRRRHHDDGSDARVDMEAPGRAGGRLPGQLRGARGAHKAGPGQSRHHPGRWVLPCAHRHGPAHGAVPLSHALPQREPQGAVPAPPARPQRSVSATRPDGAWAQASDAGELRVYEFPFPPRDIAPARGRMVLFSSCHLFHRVMPSAAPERYCLSLMFYGDQATSLPPHPPFAPAPEAPHAAGGQFPAGPLSVARGRDPWVRRRARRKSGGAAPRHLPSRLPRAPNPLGPPPSCVASPFQYKPDADPAPA